MVYEDQVLCRGRVIVRPSDSAFWYQDLTLAIAKNYHKNDSSAFFRSHNGVWIKMA